MIMREEDDGDTQEEITSETSSAKSSGKVMKIGDSRGASIENDPRLSESRAKPTIAVPKDASAKDQAIEVLKTIFDPEIPVNIYALGLVYEIDFPADANSVYIKMTLTAPNCPRCGFHHC